jgi:hypothetical protein
MSNLTKRPVYAKGQKRRRVKSEAEREDAEFLDWIRAQPSCVSGLFSEYVDGQGRCVAAHVRRASNAGTGHKPLFSAVPLTDEEHKLQHQHGEHGLLCLTRPGQWTRLLAAQWFEEQAKHYLGKWYQTRERRERVSEEA